MNEQLLAELEILFLALSDKTRLRLLSIMSGGETSVGFLAETLGESQPKISRHLAYLRNSGLVSTRRDGKWIYYQIEQNMSLSTRRVLIETLSTIDEQVRRPDRRAEHSIPYTGTVVEPEETGREEQVRDEIEIFLL